MSLRGARSSSDAVDGRVTESRPRRRPSLRDLGELVRLPGALTVPGDTLAGAAAAGWPHGGRTWVLPAASVCLYWAGMALNDYADRELDARERPERPIPSGRVRPAQAAGVAVGLTAAGIGIAGAAGGRRAAATATGLAASVWCYDLLLKPTPLAPLGMAANRALDVLLGAGPRPGAAALPALGMAVHTFGVTALSRGEVHGTDRRTAGAALTGTALSALLPCAPSRAPEPRPRRGARTRLTRLAAGGLSAAYAATVGAAQAAAARNTDASAVRAATGAGIRGMIPLQAAFVARAGHPVTATALAAAGPLTRAASRRVAMT